MMPAKKVTPKSNAPQKSGETAPRPRNLVIVDLDRLNYAVALACENLGPATAQSVKGSVQASVVGPYSEPAKTEPPKVP